MDSTIVKVHGRGKQGAAFGYTKVCGYHPRLATCAQTGQVLMSRLRGGSAGAAGGAASFLTETVSRVREAGATGELTVRVDSAFHSKAVLSTAMKFDVRFSITARQDKRVRAAIDVIAEDAWQPIPYWLSTSEVSGADIAATAFSVFASDKQHARQVRLVVRRVRPTPGSQLALFTPGTTGPSSPTGPCHWPRSRPTTAGTRSPSRPSPSSRAPGWRTCRRAIHGQRRLGRTSEDHDTRAADKRR